MIYVALTLDITKWNQDYISSTLFTNGHVIVKWMIQPLKPSPDGEGGVRRKLNNSLLLGSLVNQYNELHTSYFLLSQSLSAIAPALLYLPTSL